MKRTFEKIKLNKFSNAELEQRKLNALKGGCGCVGYCSCACNLTAGDITASIANYSLDSTDIYSY